MMSTAVKIINDGVLKLDGGSVFGQVPKVAWESNVVTDRKNRISLGLNCLLLQVSGKNVLVDTGVGPKENEKDKETLGLVPSRLLKGLKGVGLTPKDINVVILSAPEWTGRETWCQLFPRPPITCNGLAGKTR